MASTELRTDQDPSRLRDRIGAEPACKATLYKILDLCRDGLDTSSLEERISALPGMAASMHGPHLLLAWLVQAGGLERQERPDAPALWRTTPLGLSALDGERPDRRLARLLDEAPAHRDVYRRILAACLTPQTRPAIESRLRDALARQSPRFFPSYFLDRLEEAGGLEWDGGWRTTRVGLPFAGSGPVRG